MHKNGGKKKQKQKKMQHLIYVEDGERKGKMS